MVMAPFSFPMVAPTCPQKRRPMRFNYERRAVKRLAEPVMVLLCLLFWAVTLPVAGLVELGVLITDRVEGPWHHQRTVMRR